MAETPADYHSKLKQRLKANVESQYQIDRIKNLIEQVPSYTVPNPYEALVAFATMLKCPFMKETIELVDGFRVELILPFPNAETFVAEEPSLDEAKDVVAARALKYLNLSPDALLAYATMSIYLQDNLLETYDEIIAALPPCTVNDPWQVLQHYFTEYLKQFIQSEVNSGVDYFVARIFWSSSPGFLEGAEAIEITDAKDKAAVKVLQFLAQDNRHLAIEGAPVELYLQYLSEC
jgi:hypothetical protein